MASKSTRRPRTPGREQASGRLSRDTLEECASLFCKGKNIQLLISKSKIEPHPRALSALALWLGGTGVPAAGRRLFVNRGVGKGQEGQLPVSRLGLGLASQTSSGSQFFGGLLSLRIPKAPCVPSPASSCRG